MTKPASVVARTLRDQFTQQEIRIAYQDGGNYTKAAKILTALGRGEVSRQLARHWVAGLDESELPAAVSHAEQVVKTRNQQVANNSLRRDVRELVELCEAQRAALDGIAGAIEEIPKRAPIRHKLKPGTGAPMTVELLLSDLQIGKLAANYDTKTARARLFEYGRAAIFQIEQKVAAGYNVERLVLAILGDVIESDKKHKNSARATDSGTAEQMHNALVAIFELVLEPLARLGVPMDVVCVTGNHDHDDHGLMMYKPGREQLSFPLYNSLQYITARAGYPWVKFQIPEGSFAIESFYGQYVLYEHGVGVSVTESSMKSHKVKRSEQVQRHLTYFRMGDKHNVSTFNAGQYVVNGAFFGTDRRGEEYSGIAGFSGLPAQWIGFHVPRSDSRFTLYDSFCIQLDHVVEV